MKTKGYQILQLTDMHLFSDIDERLLGVNTHDSFKAVIELANELHPDPDMIALTGDLSQDETMPAYERIAEMLSNYHCPKYWIPGNHDNIDYMNEVFPIFHLQQSKHMMLEHWQVIMLNSKKEGAVEGHLDDDQFELLEQSLAAHPEHHALLFMHHHPIHVGSKWIDNLMLDNHEKFWNCIAVHKNVRSIICGHVHQENESLHKGVKFYSSPSTCFQFKPNSEKFAVDSAMPGYRVIELMPDGKIKTSVHRLDNFDLNLNEATRGY